MYLPNGFVRFVILTVEGMLALAGLSVKMDYDVTTERLIINSESYPVKEQTKQCFLCTMFYGIHSFLAN